MMSKENKKKERISAPLCELVFTELVVLDEDGKLCNHDDLADHADGSQDKVNLFCEGHNNHLLL